MAASVTHRVTTTDTGNLTNVSAGFTPASGDLIIAFVTVEANTADRTLTSSVGSALTFTQVRKQLFRTSNDALYVYVSNQRVTDTTAGQTVTINGSGSGSIISVYSVSGLTKAGTAAIRAQGGTSNQASGAPAPGATLDQAALTTNGVLSAVANSTNPAGITNAPSSWTKSQDTGYTTGQVTGLATAFRNSGETGTTITWGTNSGSASATIVVEADIGGQNIPLGTSAAVSTTSLSLTAPVIFGTRKNLHPNPTFEVDTSGWVNDFGTIAASADQAFSGSKSAKLTRTAGGTGAIDAYDNSSSRWPAVVAGATYSFSLYVYAGATRRFRAEEVWYTSGLGFISTSAGTDTSCSSGGWTRISVTAAAPATAAFVHVQLVSSDGDIANGEVHYTDAWLLEEATAVGSYFDGSLAGASWESTANLSISDAPAFLSNAVSSASASIFIPVTLQLSAAVSTASDLVLSATTQIPLDPSAAVATTSLAVSATTQIPLASSAAVSTSSLAVTAATQIALDAAAATSSSTAALTAPTQISLGTPAAISSTSLALSATTQIPLGTSAGVSTSSLAVTAQTTIPLDASSAVASNSLDLTAPTQIPLDATAAQSSSAVTLTAPTEIPLGQSDAVSSTSLDLTAPSSGGPTEIPLGASAGASSTLLALTAQTYLLFDPSAGTVTATLTVSAPTELPLGIPAVFSTATLVVTAPHSSNWPQSPGTDWTPDTGSDWAEDEGAGWAQTAGSSWGQSSGDDWN